MAAGEEQVQARLDNDAAGGRATKMKQPKASPCPPILTHSIQATHSHCGESCGWLAQGRRWETSGCDSVVGYRGPCARMPLMTQSYRAPARKQAIGFEGPSLQPITANTSIRWLEDPLPRRLHIDFIPSQSSTRPDPSQRRSCHKLLLGAGVVYE
jgi:hypothetical protein